MAKQAGDLEFIGRLGKLVFYKQKDVGFLVKTAGGATKHKIQTHRRYARVRENNTEFGVASVYCKKIKMGFAPLLQNCKDGSLHNRLMSVLVELVKSDTSNRRGERELKKHMVKQMDYLELNKHCRSGKFFEMPVDVRLEESLKVSATVKLGNAEQLPLYWNVSSAAVSMDFKTGMKSRNLQESEIFFTEKGRFEVEFEHSVDTGGAIFHGMCINFYHLVDDEFVMVNDPELMSGFMYGV